MAAAPRETFHSFSRGQGQQKNKKVLEKELLASQPNDYYRTLCCALLVLFIIGINK